MFAELIQSKHPLKQKTKALFTTSWSNSTSGLDISELFLERLNKFDYRKSMVKLLITNHSKSSFFSIIYFFISISSSSESQDAFLFFSTSCFMTAHFFFINGTGGASHFLLLENRVAKKPFFSSFTSAYSSMGSASFTSDIYFDIG